MRPGKIFFFGRSKNNEIGETFVLSHKTVSRKHLQVEISQFSTDDCHNIHTRSKITVKDFSTKIGTLLNDEQIRGQTVELKREFNCISLGRYEQNYYINWIPVVLTFSLTSREYKTDSYAESSKIFDELDVKILESYECEYTTHVVAKKRNTAKGLQALIDGKYIVHNNTFVTALIIAASTKDENPAPLETDFDGNFPDPIKYLPPKSDEPTQRDEVAYMPNKLRKNIFKGYSFIFYQEVQYNNLLSPITAGRGKATLQVVIPYQTTVEEFVRSVEKLTGENGIGKFTDEGEKRRVVVVRYNPAKGQESDWYAEFGRNVALHLNHRPIEQNEFLDAILANDASILSRPLQSEDLKGRETDEALEAPVLQISKPQIICTPIAEVTPTPSVLPHRRARRTIRPKFTGFDDDFSGPNIESSKTVTDSNFTISNFLVNESNDSHSQGLFVSQDSNHISTDPNNPALNSVDLKRTVDVLDELMRDEVDNGLAQTNVVFKRRRLNDEVEPRTKETQTVKLNELLTPDDVKIIENPSTKLKRMLSKKNHKDIDAEVEEMFLQKRKRDKAEAELKAKAEREFLSRELGGLEITEIRGMIKFEEMDVKEPKRAERPRRAEDSSRWDDHWNGRKNFKKFRRYELGTPKIEKVIVQLKEAKKGDSEFCDDFLEISNRPNPIKDKTKLNLISQETRLDVQQSEPSGIPLSECMVFKQSALEHLNRKGNSSFSIHPRDKSQLSHLDHVSSTTSSTGKIFHPSHQSQLLSKVSKNNSSHNLSGSDNITKISSDGPKLLSIKRRREEINKDESESESEDELKFSFKKIKRN